MGRARSVSILAFIAAATSAAAHAAGDIGNGNGAFGDAWAGGHPIVELRPRYNDIEEGDKPERARGWTLRAILGWRTAPWLGMRLTLEAIHAGGVGARRFNEDSARMATSPYPLLPDPRHDGVNQAFVEAAPAEALRVRAGRQRLTLDDGRWISDNDFRQVPQLFDGVRVGYGGLAGTEMTAGHFSRVRNTSGDTQELRLSVLHAAWNPAAGHALAAYGYFHDQPRNGAFTGFADNSYRVLGARLGGTLVLAEPWGIDYLVEGARQRAFAGGDARIDAGYVRAGAGMSGRELTLRLDHEIKGSNGGRYGLQMPLTDFYAFNGWSLRFFNTPPEGLRDSWLTVRLARGAFTLYSELHRFRSDHGGVDLGREADVGLAWQPRSDTLVRLQHADYRPGDFGVRIRKTWLTLVHSY